MMYKYLLFLLIVISACRKTNPEETVLSTNYAESYQYYPTKNGAQWFYLDIESDSSSNLPDSFPIRAVYSADSSTMNYFRNNVLMSYSYWSNQRHFLGCCLNTVLLNYDSINSQRDSSLIYEDNNGLPYNWIYQFKGTTYCNESYAYSTTPCLLTKQYTNLSNNKRRTIIRYFGFKIGLIYEKQIIQDANNKTISLSIQKLTAHQFWLSDTIQILPYQDHHKSDVLRLIELNTPQYFAPAEHADLYHYLDNLVDDYFVVKSDDKIVACGGINYFPEQAKAHISWDIVHPLFQRKGIGKQLLQYRINIIKNKPEISSIIVNTSQLVEAFYAANGFVRIAQEKDFWGVGIDLVRMEFQ